MKNELIYTVEKLSKAVKRLADGLKKSKDQLDRDGVIQRFEFTFELTWKSLRLFLLDQGIVVNSPKEAFKGAFKYGLIKDGKLFLDMLEDRNLTSHLYSKEETKEIFNRIKKSYSSTLINLSKELKKLIS